MSRSRSHSTPGLPAEPQGLQGDLFGLSRRVRPFDAICHPHQPGKAGELSGSKVATAVSRLANFFRLWEQNSAVPQEHKMAVRSSIEADQNSKLRKLL